ncbi:MAG: ferrous iron transport protein B [Methylocystaceae bacterium]|nr:ferrous iron transport protein B [Methylocystaceae bacterium]
MTSNNKKERLLVALAGQQNCGKSTIFNMVTGLKQHIANYPGVTVDKKSGSYREKGCVVEIVDLPGTYSLTSFSLEERVARQFLIEEKPDVVINVLDASNLRRGMYLTFQLLEMGYPVVVALNMMDVADRRGLEYDIKCLEQRLGSPVIPVIGRSGQGAVELKKAVLEAATNKDQMAASLNYGELEEKVTELHSMLSMSTSLKQVVSPRWLAVKLLENDSGAEDIIKDHMENAQEVMAHAKTIREEFETTNAMFAGDHIVSCRDHLAAEVEETCIIDHKKGEVPLSERIDRFLLNRWLAPVFLVLTVWVIYQLSIVQGYELTKITWPFLAAARTFIADLLPAAGFLNDPQIRSMGLWLVDSANTLLNYVPIFLILFSLIAILEDSGYMARIAFILDRILNRFGLHGQSTLPFILAGVFAGGCAVPGVMATKGIPDQRARLATILTVPFMNCLAKVPLYTLLINIYFVETKGLVLFYLSTITVIFALLIAKLLSSHVLKKMETAPFVMELPHYHPPTFNGVVRRAVDRTWLYIKKVGTVVVAVAAVVYILLQYPGLTPQQETLYQQRAQTAISKFYDNMEGNKLAPTVAEYEDLVRLINVYISYKAQKLNAQGKEASQGVDHTFKEAYPDYYPFLKRSKDKDARKAIRALKDLANTRKTLRREMKEERIVNSFLGQIGRSLEPVTQFANFDWKINVALLSSFAARESSVATLGVLFEQSDGENKTLEERMGSEQMAAGYTALTAAAVMIFFALYPPCLATTVMVRVQTQSWGWMVFSIVFPTALGLTVASLMFTIGSIMNLSGIEILSLLYFIVLGLLLIVGFYRKPQRRGFSGSLRQRAESS